MLRKPRPDSVIGSQLPPIIKDDVDAMLFSGASYKDVQERLAEDGIKLSQEAIRRYYHSQILPARLARQAPSDQPSYRLPPEYTLWRHSRIEGGQ